MCNCLRITNLLFCLRALCFNKTKKSGHKSQFELKGMSCKFMFVPPLWVPCPQHTPFITHGGWAACGFIYHCLFGEGSFWTCWSNTSLECWGKKRCSSVQQGVLICASDLHPAPSDLGQAPQALNHVFVPVGTTGNISRCLQVTGGTG